MSSESERIRELRKSLGLTLEEFGKRVNVTKVTISRLENGINNVTPQMRGYICKEFRVNESWLKDGVGEMHPTDLNEEINRVVEKYGLDEEDAKLLRSYVELDPKSRKEAMNYILAVTKLYSKSEDKQKQ